MSSGLRLDLHVHSAYSPDSHASLESIVARVAEAHLDGFALTDHNSIAGHRRLGELAASNPSLRLVPGVEVSTFEGHLLVLGVSELPPTHRPLVETLDWVQARNGVAVPAHLARWVHGIGTQRVATANVAAIETPNGHSSAAQNARAAELAAVRGVGTTGGSDAHATGQIGRAFTRFPVGRESVHDLLEAIRQGRTVGEGRSLSARERLFLALGNGARRVARGFRPV